MATNGFWTNGYQEEERRPGGYGGLGSAQQSNGITSMRTGGSRSWNRSRSRSRGDTGRAAKRIEDVLYYIKQDWPFMTEDKCVPVQVALQLLDDSSLGLARRYDEFQDAQEQLQSALRAIVNEHHQGFNSSIGTFHQIQASIQSSHDRVRALKGDLVRAKTNLTSTKTEFQTLVTTSNNYDDMLKVLEIIEQIQQIPQQLESKISDKLFLSAVDCLQEGLRLSRSVDLADISALSDTRVYLSNQEHSLTDILLEELHNHLYLKSPYCEERWKTYAKIHRRDSPSDLSTTTSRQLYTFLDNLDTTGPFVEDASRTPEADSFQYIQLLLEALSKLGHLEDAVEAVEQRLPVELFKVVERTNVEVQQRHPKDKVNDRKTNRTFADLNAEKRNSALVLEDFLGVLYGRFEAIAEAYRAFHEVIGGISRREDAKNTLKLTRAFKELWKLYQSEIRSLLHDYLSRNESAIGRNGQGSLAESNVFRQQRDKNKKTVFKMDLIDSDVPELKQEQDEVVAYWQKFVPGLVSLPQASTTSTASLNQGDGSATGHKLLVEPSVFNITSLLPPSVTFLKRLRDLIPPGSDIVLSTLSTFLNDFLTNVFHPQLEETLVEFCSQSFMQADAFQEHPQWARYAPRPVSRSCITFFEVVSAFCRMLDELTHDQQFTQLVIKQMNAYHERCNTYYRTLVTRARPRAGESSDQSSLKASAQLSEDSGITNAVNSIWNSASSDVWTTYADEARMLMTNNTLAALDELDLIPDARTQQALCLLFASMRWTAIKLNSLRHISPHASEENHAGMDTDEAEERPQLKRSLTRAIVTKDSLSSDEPIHLPLSTSTAAFFDGIVSAFRELSDTSLRTLRLEMRCQSVPVLRDSFTGSLLYSLPPAIPGSIAATSTSATKNAQSPLPPDTADAPDESILTLISNLLDFNKALTTILTPTDQTRITTGISTTIDATILHFLSSAGSTSSTTSKPRSLTALNAPAAAHLLTNVKVLHHNLLNIEPSSSLPRATAFLELFLQGASAISAQSTAVAEGKSKIGLDKEELKALVRLYHSEGMANKDPAVVNKARTDMEEGLRLLG